MLFFKCHNVIIWCDLICVKTAKGTCCRVYGQRSHHIT